MTYRTHTCGELRSEHAETSVKLAGWVHRKRDHGNLLFIDLRDHYGLTQIVLDSGSPSFAVAEGLRPESVISVSGRAVNRAAEQVNAKLDTGASFCIFERTYGEMLGLDVEGGTPALVSTANSTFQAFGHRLTMTALGFQFDVMVYFAADESVKRSVLGRRGFIDQLRLCLIEHDGELYVSKYDDE